jgi:hypothetical protein
MENREIRECSVCETKQKVKKSKYVHEEGWVCSKECNKLRHSKKLECATCGEVKYINRNYERVTEYTCSKKCKREWRGVESKCDECGDTFTSDRYREKKQDITFCDKDCMYRYRQSDEEFFFSTWSKKVKQREDYTCEDCGEKYDVMTAHHNPPRTELSQEEAQDTDNGICLCYPCHAERHSNEEKRLLESWWEWYTNSEE